MSAGVVMLVPGFMGSELYRFNVYNDYDRSDLIWLNYIGISTGGWRYLGLGPNGITPIDPTYPPIYPRGPIQAYYGQIMDWLRSQGWTVTVPAVDWRETIERSGQSLADFIVLNERSRPIHLIGHSRGGLVIRAALRILAQGGQLGLVGRVAGLGVPHFGAWDATGMLAGWSQAFTLLFELLTGASVPFRPPSSRESLRRTCATWPSAYNLFPSPRMPAVNPDVLAAIYDASAWNAAGLPISADWLAAAAAYWIALPFGPSTVPWLDVAGTGYVTANTLSAPRPPKNPQACEYTGEGDGFVTYATARAFDNLSITSNTPHNALVFDARIWPYLDQFFRGTLAESVTIEGYF